MFSILFKIVVEAIQTTDLLAGKTQIVPWASIWHFKHETLILMLTASFLDLPLSPFLSRTHNVDFQMIPITCYVSWLCVDYLDYFSLLKIFKNNWAIIT